MYDRVDTYFKENWKLVLILAVTDFLFNALMCLIPVVQGMAINSFSRGEPFSKLLVVCAVFLGLVLFVQLNRYVKRFLGRSFGNRIALRMRKVSYENMIHTGMSEYQNASKGDILNRILSDIADASDGITKMTTEIFDTIVLLLGYLITMFCMDVRITLIVMVFVVVSIISSKAFKKMIYGYTKAYKEYLSYSKDLTLTCLNNELHYRGFGVNKTYRALYEQSQELLEKKSLKSMILQSCLEPLYSMLTWLGLFVIVWLGGRRVLDNTLSIGVFSAFLSTYLLVSHKASRIGRVYGWYQNLRVSWVRCKPYLSKKELKRPRMESVSPDFTLRAKQFSFGFDEQFHLPYMDFEVRAGELIGVCGKVHTGKSTFLAALSNLYPYEGSLQVDGQEQKERACPTGYCSSESLVFEDTLAYNITLGREDITDDNTELEIALKDAGFLQEVCSFPEKEQQILSHSQINLSGGQQKRLMLARAVYQRPSLILLDDPFQSIDKKTVEHIMEHLRQYHNSVIFAVTNQRSLLQQMDKILLLKEQDYLFGDYEELQKDPVFQEIIREQKLA